MVGRALVLSSILAQREPDSIKGFFVKEQRFSGAFKAPLTSALQLLFASGLIPKIESRPVSASANRASTEVQSTQGKTAHTRGGRCLYGLRLMLLATTCLSPALASPTCTPLNYPAVIIQGATYQPAIVNGIDFVSSNSVRFQWTSDAATNAINYNRIVYATAAQYTANGGHIVAGTAGTNYSVFVVSGITVTLNSTIQGNSVANLASSTQYYIAGQSSGDNGVTFCPEVDETFTTPAFTGVVKPTPPSTFTITKPTITGCDYTVDGTAFSCTGSVGHCPDLQTCFNNAMPGDGIGLNPSIPQINRGFFVTRNNPNATPVSYTIGSNQWSVSGSAPANGTLLHFGVDVYYLPIGMYEGVTYSVLNSSGSTFQISLDGTNVFVPTAAGVGNFYFIAWPNTQNYVVVHSTASASALPPPGVRLDPVAYEASLGKIQLAAPAGAVLQLGYRALESFYYWENIEFDELPNTAPNNMDPYPYNSVVSINNQADHQVFDQCYFHGPPPPDRMESGAPIGGTNVAFINSYWDNWQYWAAMRSGASSTTTSSTLTIPAHSFTYPSAGNVLNTCSTNGATLTFTGSSTPVYVYWVIPSCVLTANIQTGSTATGSTFNIVTTATPAYPTITEPIDSSQSPAVLRIGSGTGGGGSVSFSDMNIIGGTSGKVPPSRYNSEYNIGIYLGMPPGPIEFINNRIGGQEIIGPYQDEYTGFYPYNAINMTVQRNSILLEPYLNAQLPAWTGGYWGGRNGPEIKQGGRTRWDGNIFGPYLPGVSDGQCALFTDFYGYNPANQVNVQDSSDIEFSNNSCISTPGSVNFGGGGTGITPPKQLQRIWAHNNLFLYNNGYVTAIEPYQQASIGRGLWLSLAESVAIDHNTWLYAAGGPFGSATGGPSLQYHLSGGISITNNILNYVTDQAYSQGFNYGQLAGDLPNPPSYTQGTALLAYVNSATFAKNVYLCQWSNSNPATYVDMTNAACAAASSLYPAGTYFPNAGSTLANRVAALSWFNAPGPGSPVSAFNLRLNHNSPYISGAHAGTDGQDIGVNMDQLEATQGKVSNVHLSLTGTTTANITFLAPDTFGCTVDYGTANFPSGTGTWTRVPNSGGQRVQTVTLTALTTGTAYTYRVNCAVMQPVGTFTTR